MHTLVHQHYVLCCAALRCVWCGVQTGEIRRPNAPLARDPWACRRLLDASLVILKEVDPKLASNKWAEVSPDGKVCVCLCVRKRHCCGKAAHIYSKEAGGELISIATALSFVASVVDNVLCSC